MNDYEEIDPRVDVRALKKLWYSYGFMAKEFPKTPASKGKPAQRPNETGARRYDMIMRFIRIVPDTELWERGLRDVISIAARYGRQQVLGLDWNQIDSRELHEFVEDIHDRLRAESAHTSQNEEYSP